MWKALQSVKKYQYALWALSSLYQSLLSVFGQFSQIFKTKVSVQTLISQCKYINQIKGFVDRYLDKLTHCESKTTVILKIKDLIFMLHSIKPWAFFDSPTTQ